MVTRKEAIKHWAEQWRTLKTWPCSLADITVDVRHSSKHHSTGRAFYMERRIVVTAGENMPDSLGTILHEYAHASRVRRVDREWTHHDDAWQAIYTAAVYEVTGIVVPPAFSDFRDLDKAARDAMASWWKNSGNEFAYKLVAAKGRR